MTDHTINLVRRIKYTKILACLALSAACGMVSADATLTQAQILLDSAEAKAAYELLKTHEGARAGDPEFDYLLGLAALDAGIPVEAVFALERVVDTNPNHGPARAELARAYIALGETDDAREEFDKVSEMDVPTGVRETIDRYMTAIDLYHDATRTQFHPWFQVAVGYDTNINSATDRNLIAVPALGGLVFTLTGTSVEENSPLWNIGGGFLFASPLSVEHGLNIFGRVGLEHRLTLDAADFSSTAGDGQLGFNLRRDKHQFRVTGETNVTKVDGGSGVRSDRETAGLTTQWQYAPDGANQFTTFAQFSIVRYPEQRTRDVNRATFGTGWGHAFSTLPGTPVLFSSGFGGIEIEQSESRGSQFGRYFYGARIGGQVAVSQRGSVFTTFTYQKSDFNTADPLFLRRRDENFFDLSGGYRFRYDEKWSLTPTIRYNKNDSNVVTSDYDRFEVVIMLRNDF